MSYNQGPIVDENIEKLIVLPPLETANLFKSAIIPLEQMKKQDPKLHEPLAALHGIISTRFEYYSEDQHYRGFQWPDSKFEPATHDWNVTVSRQKPKAAQDTFKDRMSPQQFAQIYREGTFHVPSNMSKIPYKWRVHPLIIKGRDNIINCWYTDIAVSYHQLRQIGKRINGDTLSLMLNASEIKLYPGRIVNMLVGLRQMRVDQSPNYGKLVEMRFMEYKFDKYFQNQPHELYDELYSKAFEKEYQERVIANQRRSSKIQKLTAIDRKFEMQWGPKYRAICKKYKEDKENLNENELSVIIEKEKNAAYRQTLEEQLPKKFHNQVFELLRVFLTFNALRAKLSADKDNARKVTEESIKKQHKIRSLSRYFWLEENERRLNPIYKQLDHQYMETLKKQIGLPMFNEYLEFCDNYDKQVKDLKQKLPVTYRPRRVFYTSYHVMPPYEVIKSYYGQGPTYKLKRVIQMQCDTGHHFWKFSLYKMRMESWTRNSFFWLIVNAWVGPLGFKQLLSFGRYIYNHDINYRTGEMIYYYQNGLFQQFLNVLEGIKKSRNHFESLPDTGFFGKKFSRIYNLFECYVFRLLFVGIFLLLIVKPVAIVVNTIVSLVLGVTSWLWMPLVLVVTYLFNILIYQFEIDEDHLRGRYSERIFPLINTPLMLMLNLVRIVIYTIGAVIIHPLLSALFAIWAVIRRTYSTITDEIDFILIKLLARTPSTDSAIAWKVSGPTMSHSYYSSIAEEDVYLLVQAELEKTYLGQYREQISKRIKIPSEVFTNSMHRILSIFEAGLVASSSAAVIYTSCNNLQSAFDKIYFSYLKRYPQKQNLHNVRFTVEELDHYLQNSSRIVRNFINKRECPWYFQKASLDFGDYDQLTKNILTNVFGSSILQPLESLDMRFELDFAQHIHKTAVVRALEGEISLVKITPINIKTYRPFHVNDVNILQLGDLINELTSIMGEHILHTKDSVEKGVLINPNIKEIIEHQLKSKSYDAYREALFKA